MAIGVPRPLALEKPQSVDLAQGPSVTASRMACAG